MSKIEALVFFHILGAFLIVAGAGVGMASGLTMSRTDSVRVIRVFSGLSHRCESFVTLPGGLVTLITGVWLIADYPFFDLDEFWLWGSIVLWGVAVILGQGVQGTFLRRLHTRARSLEQQGVETSEELRLAAAAPVGAVTGMVLTVITIVFLYLMVARPGA